MIGIIVRGSLSRTGGRYCGHEGPSSGQRPGTAHFKFDPGFVKARSLVFTRVKLPGDLRKNAVSDRSYWFKLSCVSRFHGRNRSTGVVGNVRKEIGEIQNA